MAENPSARDERPEDVAPSAQGDGFAYRVTIAVLIAIGLVVLTLLLWYTIFVFLLAFAGILLAVLLRAMADGVSFLTRLPKGWSLLLGSVVVILASAVGIWVLTPHVAVQVEQLHETLPAAFEELGNYVGQYEWGKVLIRESRNLGKFADIQNMIPTIASGAATALTGVITMIVGFVVAIFIGIFLAIDPAIYVRGTVRLFPQPSRARVVEILEATEHTLRWWLIGRILAMAFVGVATALALWLLDVPLALTMGLLAAILDFIPNVGPIVAAAPAVVIAFGEGPTTALWVLIAYFVVQELESYVVTPIVQQTVVSLPPAFTVFIQLLFVILAGPLGLLLATPLAAAGLVIVRGLYVQDVLGDKEIALR